MALPVEALADGMPEYEVVLHATGAMVREIARSHPDAELMYTGTWFQSGINTDGAHNPVTSRCRFQKISAMESGRDQHAAKVF